MKALRILAACYALTVLLLPMLALAQDPVGAATASDRGWQHSGVLTLLTTPAGANLPAGAVVEGFPLLVRLHKDWFDFKQAKADGADVRFSTSTGAALAYQVEEWDAAAGVASVWVRVPRIEGNARQAIRMHWGKPDAASESSGKAVFNEDNGYLSVWHLGDTVQDEVGTLESKDLGTSVTAGMVGKARHFPGKAGIFGGDKIPNYPSGASSHSSEAWFRTETPNTTIIAWGNEQAQGKVVMQFRSPPHINMDCYFSGGNVAGDSRISRGEWTHVVHTYRQGESLIYVNGKLDGSNTKNGGPLAIKSPARLWIGGWYNNYTFVGDLDEVRISKVARSADWVRLQFENQKPQQTLVGPLVQAGGAFAVSSEKAVVEEGKSVAFTAQAGGAQKIYWVLKRDGREEIVATDRFAFTFAAGRVTGDTAATLQFKAVYASEVKTKDIAITVKEAIPEPVFALKAPTTWDGRAIIEVVPQVANLAAMQAKGAGELKTEWSAGPFAVIKEVAPGKLRLLRAQNSGKLSVTATVSNGGQSVTQSVSIQVTEPKRDAWLARVPAKDEQPEEGQFYARDEKNEGTLHYNGTLAEAADTVFLKLYADEKLVKTETAKPGADKAYALSVKLKAGLIKYRVEFGTRAAGKDTLLNTVGNLVCGDAYIIEGQSNALATDTREQSPPETNEWIRSYARPSQNPKDNQGNLWCLPVWKAQKGEKAELGWWGMELAKRLVESQKMPVFLINAAVGGTRIDQHQRSATNPTDLTTIYGRMLWRVQQAKLTHGIRGILWHQGESDQGSDGPTGGFGWESYQPLFVEMAGAWKQDFPNVQHYYAFQIWPNSCAMGGRDGAGDRLREKQRTLPQLFSNLSILSTLGVRPPGGCHFPLVGWAEFARMVQPLIERDVYGKKSAAPLTAPNLRRASSASATGDALALEFDQPVVWNDTLAGQFYLDGAKDKVASGSVAGNVLTLKLKEASAAKQITYLKEIAWSQDTLLIGANGLAALTFCEVPILIPAPKR
ncbi:MAG: hypothetical protein RL514_603 [Verrucomicrobiota bacterium]|jgi:hypothetical protein